jgi:hypothetical protein
VPATGTGTGVPATGTGVPATGTDTDPVAPPNGTEVGGPIAGVDDDADAAANIRQARDDMYKQLQKARAYVIDNVVENTWDYLQRIDICKLRLLVSSERDLMQTIASIRTELTAIYNESAQDVEESMQAVEAVVLALPATQVLAPEPGFVLDSDAMAAGGIQLFSTEYADLFEGLEEKIGRLEPGSEYEMPAFVSEDLSSDLVLEQSGLLKLASEQVLERTAADGDNTTRSYEFSVQMKTGVPSLDDALLEQGRSELAATDVAVSLSLRESSEQTGGENSGEDDSEGQDSGDGNDDNGSGSGSGNGNGGGSGNDSENNGDGSGSGSDDDAKDADAAARQAAADAALLPPAPGMSAAKAALPPVLTSAAQAAEALSELASGEPEQKPEQEPELAVIEAEAPPLAFLSARSDTDAATLAAMTLLLVLVATSVLVVMNQMSKRALRAQRSDQTPRW